MVSAVSSVFTTPRMMTRPVILRRAFWYNSLNLSRRRIKKVVESESEEEIVEQVIIKKKSNNNKLTNNEKVQLAEQSAEERLRQSLKEDRLNYLLNQIGAKL